MAAETYITIQGDAWDAIAHKVYGDVKYTGWLMQHNFPLLDIFVFGSGAVLRTPGLPGKSEEADAPIWRTSR